MNRTSILILISVLVFVGINTLFYITIFNQQLEFQTELISQQTKVCANTIEQEGFIFENELNSIPFQNDFTQLFTDEEIKQQGSIHLQRWYTGYSDLINKITVYDNNANVYSLILDYKDNFVSDYYESQRQITLNERDELFKDNGKYLLTIPGFDNAGTVNSNILVDLNFERFVKAIFERYTLEQTLWQTLLTAEGELLATSVEHVMISESDISRIGSNIREESEGAFVHTISIDSIPTRVVSFYYPIRLVKRDLGIIFSMKTDLFLRTIIIKIIFISVLSLILIVLLLYIHFRVIKSKSLQNVKGKFYEDSLKNTIDALPVGLIFIQDQGKIQLINRTAMAILDIPDAGQDLSYEKLGLDKATVSVDDSIYNRTFGEGSLLLIRKEANLKYIYHTEWEDYLGEASTRVVMLIDVSLIESSWNLNKTAHLSRTELLESMGQEISVPLNKLRETISLLNKNEAQKDISSAVEDLKKSCSLLSNLINATMDFACQRVGDAVTEEIPFSLQCEIELALEPFRGNNSQINIITKIRKEVPDDLIGDPFRFRQVIYNLVNNALGLTTEGRILISSELIDHHEGILKIQFHVEDTGSGLSQEKIREIMTDLDLGATQSNMEPDEYKLRLSVAKQHIELLKGQLWLSSPSTISTNPDQPGIKCTFTMELFSGTSVRENLVYKDIRNLKEVGCLVLSQEKDTENTKFAPLQEMGLNLKYLIYRRENLESLFELVKEKLPELHMIFINNSTTQDGFLLADELKRKKISENRIMVLLSSDHQQENYSRSREAGIEYYIEEPYELFRFAEILKNHFPDINQEALKEVPGPVKIDESLKVLLAEDNVFNRKVIQGLFKRLGCEIDQAKNGREAVDIVGGKDYDIIFMDLLMPEMDGIQAVAEIRKSGLTIPIIALTAVEDKETRQRAIDAGFDGYLIKPASEESLRKIILQSSSKSN